MQRQLERQEELLRQQDLVHHDEELKRIQRETERVSVIIEDESSTRTQDQLEHIELTHVRHFAKTLAEQSYDVNGDGRFDLDDEEGLLAGYEDALMYAEDLPEDVVYLLDQDSDSLISESDKELALENLRKVMGLQATRDASSSESPPAPPEAPADR